uniref:Uncharacterized protein n=1 Tax=Glossina austeni TaxID=7395 RepID=A0A1A9V193_GLOAU
MIKSMQDNLSCTAIYVNTWLSVDFVAAHTGKYVIIFESMTCYGYSLFFLLSSYYLICTQLQLQLRQSSYVTRSFRFVKQPVPYRMRLQLHACIICKTLKDEVINLLGYKKNFLRTALKCGKETGTFAKEALLGSLAKASRSYCKWHEESSSFQFFVGIW